MFVSQVRERYRQRRSKYHKSLQDGDALHSVAHAQLVEIFDNLVHVGGEACLDVERLRDQIAYATNEPGTLVHVAVLYPLYPAYGDMCEAVANALKACRLYLISCRVLDDDLDHGPRAAPPEKLDPLTAFNNFVTLCAEVPPLVTEAHKYKCWDRTRPCLQRELNSSLEMLPSLRWIFVVGGALSLDSSTSRRVGLLNDLPSIDLATHLHLRQLGELFTMLEDVMRGIESVRLIDAPPMGAPILCSQILGLSVVFPAYKSALTSISLPKYLL
ncbi:hypothetical protein B0H17DRAFT_1099534 [Mycena rosella]|uniref:Uncharacterized protein n=1 Tax=Mycena rosella TaxID=1033263 RepID=A0AAD7CR39_MYCRO|nr:hypothetical protein B0H17DRAFT_1099534 [Mycena rosella]